jgi:hypothetical protein
MSEPHKVTVELSTEEAWALLRFLLIVPPVPSIREDRELDAAYKEASLKVRIALRDAVEPGWRDEDLDDLSP